MDIEVAYWHLANRKTQALGLYGEIVVCELLREHGYEAELAKLGSKKGDIEAVNRETGQVFKVEVKTARKGRNRMWNFTLLKEGYCDHKHADIVVLLAVLKTGNVVPFVIPTSVIANQKTLKIPSFPSLYGGKYAKYRQKVGELKLEVFHE